jgi:hypothetical protein
VVTVLVKAFLLVLGGIVAFNVVTIAGLALSEIRDRRRRGLEVRYLQALWHVDRHRMVRSGHVRSSMARAPFRPWGGKPLGVALIAVMVFAGTALASTGARKVATSVLTSVAEELGLQPAETEVTVAAAPSVDVAHRSPDEPNRVDGSSTAHVHHGGGSGSAVGTGGDEATGSGADGEGSPSPDPSPDPSPSPSVLAPPGTVVAFAVSSSQIDLDWTDVAGETGYQVERLSGSDWDGIAEMGADVTSYSDTGLTAGTVYAYRVFAVSEGERSDPSAVATATTATDPPGSTSLEASAVSSTEIHLTWVDVSTETGYRIERSFDGENWETVFSADANVTSHTDAGLSAGTTYYYRVVATNAAGSSASNVVQVTTMSDVPGTTEAPAR